MARRSQERWGIILAGLVAAVLHVPPIARAQSPRAEPTDDAASPASDPERQEERYSVHFQSTMASQYHPTFSADYSGDNSLGASAEWATALVSTLYIDVGLWPGAELIFDPEISGGKGLSQTLGVAAFPSGIVYRVGDPAPAVYVARIALRQEFGLGGGSVLDEAAPNQLARTRDRDALAITVGRVSVTDVFDGNEYAHDATERFFNWALFASGAWDYPADTRGYTWAVLAELRIDWWSARAGIALEPKFANDSQMDWRILESHGLMAEYEARYALGPRAGAARLLLFFNRARMGSYQQVLDDPAAYGNSIVATRADGRTKYGFALSVDQQVTPTLGAFLRLSANDGANETWAFTEIDRSLALGAVQNGSPWQRPRDEAGAALVVDAISNVHERYLAGGGYGFILGDSALDYAPEVIGEVYYKLSLAEYISLTGIYQAIIDPAYNTARGPVHVFTGRLHVAF